jgi:primosomal protein N' (replication factor Y)
VTIGPGFAEVVVGAGNVRGAQTFHYEIPADLKGQVHPGQLVLVPFGTSQSYGVVMDVAETAPVEDTRPIFDIIGGAELIDVRHLELARLTAEHYAAPILAAVELVAPPGLARRLQSSYTPTGTRVDPSVKLSRAEARTLDLVQDLGEASEVEIRRIAGKTAARSGVRRLVAVGLLNRRISLHLPQPASERAVTVVGPTRPGEIEAVLARAPKQRALWEILRAADGSMPVSDALAAADAAGSALKGLVSRGLARVSLTPRTSFLVNPDEPSDSRLADVDDAAWRAVQTSLASDGTRTLLLQGDTHERWGVYACAVAAVVADGAHVLVITPDGRNAADLADWLALRVQAKVASQTRARTDAEHVALWAAVRKGEVDVLVGTRSACYAPLPSIGLVIVDREEDGGHKNRNTPRFHTRTVSTWLAELSGCLLLLGTETPSVEAFFDVDAERSRFVIARSAELMEQVGQRVGWGMQRPAGQTEVVDMREAVTAGRHGAISRPLFEALRSTLDDGGRAVLYVNRRGTAALTVCRDCGHLFGCPRCSTRLVHHRDVASLQCHVCNWREESPRVCPSCGGRRLRLWGYGTEAVMEAVAHLFPRSKVARIDSDCTDREVEAAVGAFKLRTGVDVLVGTQRLAVFGEALRASLLGIVQADVGLQFPDFLAPERVFTMIMRLRRLVTGGERGGRTLIQTLMPTHHVIEAVCSGSYLHFFRAELAEREIEQLPPFRPVARATFAHPDDARAAAEAQRARRELETIVGASGPLDLEILGPAPATIHRRRGQYVWQLLVFGADARRLLPELHGGWTVDVDPTELT